MSTPRRRVLRAVTGLTVGAFALAACGTSGDNTPASSSDTKLPEDGRLLPAVAAARRP